MNETIFFRLLADDDKGAALNDAVAALRENSSAVDTFSVDPASFEQIPGAPFSYWVDEKLRRTFANLPSFANSGRTVKQGLATADDFQFLRLWWEVLTAQIVTGMSDAEPKELHQQTISGKQWASFAKGGSYSPYYADIHLVVNWQSNGEQIKTRINNQTGRPFSNVWQLGGTENDYFFRPGLTWPLRTNGLSFRLLPKGGLFGHKGPVVFVATDQPKPLLALAAVMNSQAFYLFVQMLVARVSLAQSFEVGLIKSVPIPDLSERTQTKLGQLALTCVDLKRNLDTINEISHVFQLPALLQAQGETLAERIGAWQARVADTQQQLAAHQREIDDIAFELYGIAGEDRRAIEASLSGGSAEASEADAGEPDEDDADSTAPPTDSRPLVVDLLAYTVGGAFGRWDVRFATGERAFPELPDPFAPLPVYAPAALIPESDRTGYPLTLAGAGLLVDDPHHPDDIVRRIQAVLELLWDARADAIAQEACALLGVKDMRDYLRKGFFDDHIKRYSKSRRKAPIYWLLQSPKRSYGVWLYYHRLDADMLFKVLMQYVEPKLRLEQDRLDALRQERQQAGTSGKEARQAEKALAQQEALVADVQEFHDRLERAAKHYLTPDLNDGVVLTIAPLWELVPWKEARTYWNELLAGKYEWSSIGTQLRQKGLIK